LGVWSRCLRLLLAVIRLSVRCCAIAALRLVRWPGSWRASGSVDSTDDYLLAGEVRISKWVAPDGSTFVTFDADDGVSEFEIVGMLRVAGSSYERYLTGLYESGIGESDE